MKVFSRDVTDAYRAEGWWDGLTIHELFVRNADRNPDAPALVDAPNRAEFCGGGEPGRGAK
jgi:non-ribosomal peptide synthetase component E (peptide arylation enzyme)